MKDLFDFQNLKRVAEVWMDEYAEYIYQRRPEYRHLAAGDMAVQKDLRSQLNCKSFKWFMTKVAWDLPKHYPPVEPPAAAWGEVGPPPGHPLPRCSQSPCFTVQKSDLVDP